MTTVHRVYNFAAGPAVLPVPVLEEIQRDLLALPGVGMSILEISHRSTTFESILAQAEADIRTLGRRARRTTRCCSCRAAPALQFSMVPMNLLDAGRDRRLHRLRLVGATRRSRKRRRSAPSTSRRRPRPRTTRACRAQAELKLTPGAAYVHMTSNNTIEGTEYKTLPDVGDVPLVSDTSSDMFSRPIDVARHALIYAGAQKNIGPAGVTVVIIRDDLLPRSQKSLPTMLNYAVHAENGSLYNTPPTFAVYALGLVMKWLIAQGGLAGDRGGQRAQGGEALRGDRSHRLLPRHGAQGLPVADERHVPAGDRGAREAVRQGIDRGRARRPEGAPVGRRHARVDLQRVPRGGRRRAGRLHAGVRARNSG